PVTSGLVTGGTASASFTLPGGTPAGSYQITTTYSGGTNFQGSSDNTGSLTIDPPVPLLDTTIVSANASAGFDTIDQPVILSATVSTTGSSTAVNEGTVTFQVFQGLTQIGSSVTSSTVTQGNASATFTLPSGTAAGPY